MTTSSKSIIGRRIRFELDLEEDLHYTWPDYWDIYINNSPEDKEEALTKPHKNKVKTVLVHKGRFTSL